MLVDVNHDMACMREETFGPTLPIMKVADAEEAIRLANDSEYGLCAAVFSRDLAHAEAVARRVNSGAVTVNDALLNYTALELPMGGAKPGSGLAIATARVASASTVASRRCSFPASTRVATSTCTRTRRGEPGSRPPGRASCIGEFGEPTARMRGEVLRRHDVEVGVWACRAH
ncbi:aldehyde dehydrogenase family protein [Mycobacterium ulcerans str. Harvey]|uniref:Putative succinate-semialdehyde dehydrogenase [NADP(+)] 2 n=1 Tax=Mycobacterium ulcerans str. Harvey TaxID=1299332 RepID=A0ABN0QTL8_MYCUL|nr:aldehyde dehydrogenase family protein [Mycobacterium ulcerans str. Harvey]